MDKTFLTWILYKLKYLIIITKLIENGEVLIIVCEELIKDALIY